MLQRTTADILFHFRYLTCLLTIGKKHLRKMKKIGKDCRCLLFFL